MTVVMLLLTAATLIVSFGTTAYEQCFNYYIKDVYSFSPSYNGMLKAVLGFVTLIVNFTIGLWIMRKTKLKNSLVATTFLCGLTMLGILLTGDVVSFILVNVVIFALNAIYQPILQTIFADSARGTDNGLVMGVFNSVKNMGNILGALFAGFVYSFGPNVPFVYAAIGFLLVAGLTFLAGKREKRDLAK